MVRNILMNRMYLSVLMMVGLVSAGSPTLGSVERPDDAAAQANRQLKAARAAIGSDSALRGLKALVFKGNKQQPTSHAGAMMSSPLEFRFLFPDSYLRIDTSLVLTRTSGVTADGVVQKLTPLKPGLKLKPQPPQPIAVTRAQFARLILGMLADTEHPLPLNVRGGSGAGAVYTVELSGPDDFSALLDLDTSSHLPVRVRYQAQMPPTRAIRLSDSKTTHVATDGPLEKAEVTFAFEDHRIVDGLNLPHRIRGFAHGVTFEEIQIDKVLVNPPLGPKDFNPDVQP
jgi:hypothetical protein